MRWRAAVLCGVVGAAAIALGAVTSRDDEPRQAAPPISSTTASTAPVPAAASTSETTAVERPPLALLDHPVAPLPVSGIGLVTGDQILLLNERGETLAWGPTGDARLVSPDDVAIADVVNGKVRLRADPSLRAGRGDCLPAHAVGGVTVERCGSPSYNPPRIDVTDGRGTRTLITSPPPLPGVAALLGGWRSAKVSPNGRTVLAQWSGECEVPATFFIDVATGRVSVTTGESVSRWNLAPATTSAGWLPDGSAVIARGRSACGTSGAAGVYVVTPGAPARLFHRVDSADRPSIFAWRRDSARSGACPLPVDVGAMPPGWDPTPRPGWAEGHGIGTAIAHWVGPDPRGEVITVVGRDGGGLVAPLSDGTVEPVEVFTSMGNPAFVVPIHEAFAAEVDPPNAPAGCSPLFLIGDSITASTLRTVAESLSSRHAPPVVDIAVTGAAVRGSTISIRATGAEWPAEPIEVELARPDGFGRGSAGTASPAPDGRAVEAMVHVPMTFWNEGPCPRGLEICDLISVAVGPLRVRFRESAGERRILAEGSFDVVDAVRDVGYAAFVSRSCGPARIEFDGVTWVTVDPDAFTSVPGEQHPEEPVAGTLTIRSADRAEFRSSIGTTAALRKSPTGFAC